MRSLVATVLALVASAAAAFYCAPLQRSLPSMQFDGDGCGLSLDQKYAVAAMGSNLEDVHNVASFLHGANPVNYSKLLNGQLDDKLLPGPYLKWMFDEIGVIFSTDYHHVYPSGTNTIEVFGLDAPCVIPLPDDDYHSSADVYEGDIRYRYEGFPWWPIFPPDGQSPAVVAVTNAYATILGRVPTVDATRATLERALYMYNYVPMWLRLTAGDRGFDEIAADEFYPYYMILGDNDGLSAGRLCVFFGVHGPSTLAVETEVRAYTHTTTYSCTLATNTSFGATASFSFVSESSTWTNIARTVASVDFGERATARASASGSAGEIAVSSRARSRPAAQGWVTNTFDGVQLECLPVYYVPATNAEGTVDVGLGLQLVAARVLSDLPFNASTYPPSRRHGRVDAFAFWSFACRGEDFWGNDVDEHGADICKRRGTSDAMAVALQCAQAVTNEMAAANAACWCEGSALPTPKYKRSIPDVAIQPKNSGLYACYTSYADRSYVGWCSKDDWILHKEPFPDPGEVEWVRFTPAYEDTVYGGSGHVEDPWELEIGFVSELYGNWDFMHWVQDE